MGLSTVSPSGLEVGKYINKATSTTGTGICSINRGEREERICVTSYDGRKPSKLHDIRQAAQAILGPVALTLPDHTLSR